MAVSFRIASPESYLLGTKSAGPSGRDWQIDIATAMPLTRLAGLLYNHPANVEEVDMELTIDGFGDSSPIPARFALAVPDPATHVHFSDNRNPGLRWRGAPENTKSLVLVCVDTDAPTRPDDVNQEGREVPADLPRADFYHWLLVDIPPSFSHIDEGACSDSVTAHGKKEPPGPAGSRQGANDYTSWFEGDADMEGVYLGYDGPCPPWNDSLVHHYHFHLFATDLERLPVEGAFRGADVMAALQGHVLAQACVTGTYSLNPALAAG
jgi:Raf kinase inhibitor-like YbhB/YbcL family protein